MKHISSLTQLLSQYFTPAEIAANRQLALISSAIEIWRADHSMTQKDFADFMGITQAMVSKWESGEYNFTVKTLSEISTKLGMSLETLFSGNLAPHTYDASEVVSQKTRIEASKSSTTTVSPKFVYRVIQGGAA